MSRGSSPLARGGHPRDREQLYEPRLIPARAGRTGAEVLSRVSGWAHPRSRGADIQVGSTCLKDFGSSPLARGGHAVMSSVAHAIGLIPARAGRTFPSGANNPARGAHPRSRGADCLATRGTGRSGGSSPLARGGRPGAALPYFSARLIPARAGRTPTASQAAVAAWAHPRSRGADADRSETGLDAGGSSPLARGGRRRSSGRGGPCRLIPARAGRTAPYGQNTWAYPAHPRSRGADVPGDPQLAPARGSSPLARGGRVRLPISLPDVRLIPARAGRTRACDLDRRHPWAHPRSRGADPRKNRRNV